MQIENCLDNTSTSDRNNGKRPSGATWYGNELWQLYLPKLTHYYLPVFKLDYTGSVRSSDSRLWKFSVHRAPKSDLYVNNIGLESRHYQQKKYYW